MPEKPISNIVKLGMQVDLELLDQHGGSERFTLHVVADKAADFDAGFLGAGTRLAQAIMDKKAGQTIPYRVGDLLAVRILAVSPGKFLPDENRSSQRDVTLQKANADIDRKNALLFASSFSGKWGDYDPEGIEHWDEKDSHKDDKPSQK